MYGSSEDISQFKAFFMGMPSKWSQHLFRIVMLLLPLAFFAPLMIHAYRKPRKLEDNGRLRLSLFHRCMSVLLAYVILIGPWGFEQLAQADIAYSELCTTDWAIGNSTITYTYDANGSVETKTTTVDSTETERVLYEYNLQGRLKTVKVSTDGGTTWSSITEYKYNPNGIRVEKDDNGTVTDYLIDSYNHTGHAQVFKERQGTTTTYIIGHDVLAQSVNYTGPTDVSYLLYDGHGSTRQLTNNSGSLIINQSFDYDAYGYPLSGVDTASTNLLYSGEMLDRDLDQYYLRARWYNQSNGWKAQYQFIEP